jgi:hypothetical protein
MFGAVRAFEMKLKLFWKQLEYVDMPFFFLWFASWDGSVGVPVQVSMV